MTDRVKSLAGIVGRIQSLADGLTRRTVFMAWLGLIAAPIAWLTLFGRWAFDSVPRLLFFLVALAVMATPGLVLLAFGRLLGGTVSRSQTALADLKEVAASGGAELGTGVASVVSKPGLRSFGSVIGSLWRLREFRSDFGSIVGAAVGSSRLLNPLFLLWVGAAALGVGLVIVLAAAGLVLVVL